MEINPDFRLELELFFFKQQLAVWMGALEVSQLSQSEQVKKFDQLRNPIVSVMSVWMWCATTMMF